MSLESCRGALVPGSSSRFLSTSVSQQKDTIHPYRPCSCKRRLHFQVSFAIFPKPEKFWGLAGLCRHLFLRVIFSLPSLPSTRYIFSKRG